MSENVVTFSHVVKRYGDKTVLRDISFEIERGEFISVIGSSGCGKTTLLRMINGLIEPSEGRINVFGNDISAMDKVALRRSIGYAIQEVGLFPHMTVKRNIEYVPSLLGKKERQEATFRPAEELMDIVGLDRTLIKRYPNELSGGQRQRVGLARALAASPEILLMDEAFAAVDEITRKRLQDEILAIHESLHITIVFVTHSIKEAMRLADRVFVLDAGELIQMGTVEEIQEHPATKFVADLISEK